MTGGRAGGYLPESSEREITRDKLEISYETTDEINDDRLFGVILQPGHS